MPTYSWLSQSDAVAALESRLSGSQFWGNTELWLYISEGLRIWNALTECWRADFTLIDANGAWINTATASGSPRLRSVTCNDLYTQMEYMLLEPATGGTWTGSAQFDITALQTALQRRTQEVIQAAACNLTQLSAINTTPGTRRNPLGDDVLEPRRIRFLGTVATTTGTAGSGSQTLTLVSKQDVAAGQIVTGTNIQAGTYVVRLSGLVATLSLPTTGALSGAAVQFAQPITLTREDTQAFQYFEPDYLQTYSIPQSWSIASEPPLAFDVDTAPTVPGKYDVLALVSGPVFSSPAPSLLGVPDDWAWLPMYGALADLLGREAEATDRPRAAYCFQRYVEGMEQMRNSNWLLNAALNNIAVDTPALAEMDSYCSEWQTGALALPAVVQAGIDFVAPVPGNGQSLSLTLVGNAPLLSGGFVQVSRDDFEAVLNYAQHIALFKQGNQEFASTLPLLKDFYRAVQAVTKRQMNYGLFTDVLNTQGERQEEVVTR